MGAVSGVGFPSANTLVALLGEHKLLNSDISIEHLWMARLVLKTLGIEMEEVLNKALVSKGIVKGGRTLMPGRYGGVHLATDVHVTGRALTGLAMKYLKDTTKTIWVVVRDAADYMMQITRHNSHHRTKCPADASRLVTWTAIVGEIFRTYPHNLEGGGAGM